MFLVRSILALFALTWQSAFLALGQIWANKVRAILTTIGIVIGVASVTAVIAALTGLKASVLAEFESFGTNKIFILPDFAGRTRGREMFIDIQFKPKHFEGLLDHCPSVRAFTRITTDGKSIGYGTESESEVQVQGIDPAWHEIENRAVVLGRRFLHLDNEDARAVCIINTKAAEKLGMPRDPTGSSLIIGDRRHTVVGVIETRTESSMFGERMSQSEVYVPFNTARHGRRDMPIHVVAASRSPDLAEEAKAEITFFLRKTRQIPIGGADNFRVEAVETFLQGFRNVYATVTIVATAVVGISLLVGGVGIMNIMLVSVSERTREIGLRKAVGARPGAILLQFLIEAMMLCLMGGLIGLICGQGLTSLLASIPQAKLERASIPGWAVALAFGFAGAVGLLFGMFPAIKAARLDPIEALRHE